VMASHLTSRSPPTTWTVVLRARGRSNGRAWRPWCQRRCMPVRGLSSGRAPPCPLPSPRAQAGRETRSFHLCLPPPFPWSLSCDTHPHTGIFHHSIPVLSQSVKDKSRLRSIFAVAFGITTGFYVVIGMIISLYFGKEVRSRRTPPPHPPTPCHALVGGGASWAGPCEALPVPGGRHVKSPTNDAHRVRSVAPGPAFVRSGRSMASAT
jgi:hypothetical protein